MATEECYFSACNLTNNSTPLWVFFMFFKLFKWYQTAQSITYWKDRNKRSISTNYGKKGVLKV